TVRLPRTVREALFPECDAAPALDRTGAAPLDVRCAAQAFARAASSCDAVSAVLRRFEIRIATTMIATETTAIRIRASGEASGPTLSCTTAGAISNETRFITLINGLIAGPAVSLNGSPTVSPITVASCASDPLPP